MHTVCNKNVMARTVPLRSFFESTYTKNALNIQLIKYQEPVKVEERNALLKNSSHVFNSCMPGVYSRE